jgi:sugar transferase (PEP-CTERM system associated)
VRLFKHYIQKNIILLVVLEYAISGASLLFGSLLIGNEFPEEYASIYVLLFIPIINTIVFYIGDMYGNKEKINKREIVSRIFFCGVVGFFIISCINFLLNYYIIDFSTYMIYLIISMPTIILFRIFYEIIIKTNTVKRSIIILGYSKIVDKIYEELRGSKNTYKILGVVCDEYASDSLKNREIEIIGSIKDSKKIMALHNPDMIIIALSERRGSFPIKEVLDSKIRGISIEDATSFYEKITGKILIQNLRPSWIIFSDGFNNNIHILVIKRFIDVVLAVLGICLSSPLMLLIGTLVKLESLGPIFFKQERVGENGKTFTLVKFRTMVADAEKETGPVWSQTIDPRVTRLGKILRRTGMDEIPQLFNVLKGDMSFVGPRPERPHFVTELQEKIPYYAQRLAVKPGITGWAQVRYGYGATLDDAVEKLQYDLYYIKNMSIFLDVLIILSTIHKVIFAKVAVESIKDSHDTQDDRVEVQESQLQEPRVYLSVPDGIEREVRETKIYG